MDYIVSFQFKTYDYFNFVEQVSGSNSSNCRSSMRHYDEYFLLTRVSCVLNFQSFENSDSAIKSPIRWICFFYFLFWHSMSVVLFEAKRAFLYCSQKYEETDELQKIIPSDAPLIASEFGNLVCMIELSVRRSQNRYKDEVLTVTAFVSYLSTFHHYRQPSPAFVRSSFIVIFL